MPQIVHSLANRCRLARRPGYLGWEAGAVQPAPSPDDLVPDLAGDLALALQLADVADAITFDRFRAADLRVTQTVNGSKGIHVMLKKSLLRV